MRFRQSLADVLRHSKPERRFNLAAFQFFAQLLDGRNVQLLVNAQNAFGIEAGIVGESRDFRRRLPAQGIQFLSFPVSTISRMALAIASPIPGNCVRSASSRTSSSRLSESERILAAAR